MFAVLSLFGVVDTEWKAVLIYIKRDGTKISLEINKLDRMNGGSRGCHFTRQKQGEKLSFEISKSPSLKLEGEIWKNVFDNIIKNTHVRGIIKTNILKKLINMLFVFFICYLEAKYSKNFVTA